MKSTKTNRKLNVRLLRRVKRHILEEPRRLLMAQVAVRKLGDNDVIALSDVPNQRFAPCGTAACIAGWALILSNKPAKNGFPYLRKAAKLLGVRITNFGGNGRKLFFTYEWPRKFDDKFAVAKTAAARAKAAAERIEHFIKTGE